MENKNILMARQIAAAVAQTGGRAYYVGGFVRDRLLGIDVSLGGFAREYSHGVG